MDSVPSAVPYSSTASERLAHRFEQDMRQRGLGPGDRYMTAAEGGRLLNVSRATANSAMRLLAERQLLVRHRKRGTFVGPRLKRPTVVGAPTVYVLKIIDLPRAFDSISADEMIGAMRQAIGGTTSVQFCFPPDRDEVSHLQQVISSAQNSPGPFGVIAVSSTRQVYQCLLDSAVPSVVLGTPFAGQHDLPSIDYDHLRGGRLLMQYLIRRGHDRMAVLVPVGACPGDGAFLRGLNDAMSEAARLPNTLDLSIAPRDPVGVAAEVEHLMAQPDRATALICTSEQIGKVAVDTVSGMGLSVPGDVEVVFNSRWPENSQPVEHTQLRHPISLAQMCGQAGVMLQRQWEGMPLKQKRVVIPTALCERESMD